MVDGDTVVRREVVELGVIDDAVVLGRLREDGDNLPYRYPLLEERLQDVVTGFGAARVDDIRLWRDVHLGQRLPDRTVSYI